MLEYIYNYSPIVFQNIMVSIKGEAINKATIYFLLL